MEISGLKIKPFIFMTLVIIGLIPFMHWVVITPTVFRDELVMVSLVTTKFKLNPFNLMTNCS